MNELIRKIISSMGNELTADQSRKLENVFVINLTEFLHRDTEVSTKPADWKNPD